MKFIDAHVHFYDINRPEGLDWPSESSPIYKTSLPQDLIAAHEPATPVACVAIETSRRFSDDLWLFELAKQTPFIAGVVANLDIMCDSFGTRLKQGLKNEKFKGIRLRPISEIPLNSELLSKHLELLPPEANIVEAGCPTARQLDEFTLLAKKLRKSKFILDHFGHPSIDGSAPSSEWVNAIKRFAEQENCYCKITALTQFAHTENAPSECYFPVLSVLENSFGSERLIYGSNWTPVNLTRGVTPNKNILLDYLADSPSKIEAIFFSNAVNIYSLKI